MGITTADVLESLIESRKANIAMNEKHLHTITEMMAPSSGHRFTDGQFAAMVAAMAALRDQSKEWTERVEKMRGWLREGCVFTSQEQSA